MDDATDHKRAKDLETIIVLAAACLVFFFVFKKPVLPLAALVFLVTGLFFKKTASRVSDLWLRFSHVLGAFNSRVIMLLVFYLALTPMAFLFRLFNKNHLQLKKAGEAKSYFIDRDHSFKKEDFEKIW